MNKPKTSAKPKNPYRNAGILIGVLLVLAILLVAFRGCEGDKPTENPADTAFPGIVYDDGAVEGGWNEADTEKIIASLNEKVEEGMINISMNTSPTFKDGTSEGNLMIVNEGINRYFRQFLMLAYMMVSKSMRIKELIINRGKKML